MSSTGRVADRAKDDQYMTPPWAVWRFLDAVDLVDYRERSKWLEPCAGTGNVIRAVEEYYGRPGTVTHAKRSWTAVEKDEALAKSIPLEAKVWGGVSFFNVELDEPRYDVVITNPPYLLAMDFVEASLKIADTVCMLLRLNFCGSEKRNSFFRKHMPDIYVLPNRPSFDGKGSDSIEYAWYVWQSSLGAHQGSPRWGNRVGSIQVLETTENEIRQTQKPKETP